MSPFGRSVIKNYRIDKTGCFLINITQGELRSQSRTSIDGTDLQRGIAGVGKPASGTERRSTSLAGTPGGASEIVLVCEHASKKLPAALGNLGLGEKELASHIGWDIGALGVARRLSETLGCDTGLAGLFAIGI